MPYKAQIEKGASFAYFCTVDGRNIFPFQFSPDVLRFSESSNFYHEMVSGRYDVPSHWISGRPQMFPLRLFIDRTGESRVNEAPSNSLNDYEQGFLSGAGIGGTGLYSGILQGVRSAASRLRRTGGDYEFELSSYDMSPHFKKRSADDDEQIGVYKDLENLLKLMRPKGYPAFNSVQTPVGSIEFTEQDLIQFQPPEKLRFFHGALWKEGYIVSLDYELSVMNGSLIPRRMDANLMFLAERSGIIAETAKIPDEEYLNIITDPEDTIGNQPPETTVFQA